VGLLAKAGRRTVEGWTSMPKARHRRPPPVRSTEADHPEPLAEQLDPGERLPVHLSPFIAASAGPRSRASASISPTASSAVANGVAAGEFMNEDAPAGGRREVDVVDPHPGPADHLQAPGGVDHLGRHPAAAADEDRVVGRHELDEIGGGSAFSMSTVQPSARRISAPRSVMPSRTRMRWLTVAPLGE